MGFLSSLADYGLDVSLPSCANSRVEPGFYKLTTNSVTGLGRTVLGSSKLENISPSIIARRGPDKSVIT